MGQERDGDKGMKGDKGENGIVGLQGAKGDRGETGERGEGRGRRIFTSKDMNNILYSFDKSIILTV